MAAKKNVNYSDNIIIYDGIGKYRKAHAFDELIKYADYTFKVRNNVVNYKDYDTMSVYNNKGKRIGKIVYYSYDCETAAQMFTYEAEHPEPIVYYMSGDSNKLFNANTKGVKSIRNDENLYKAFCDAAIDLINDYESK